MGLKKLAKSAVKSVSKTVSGATKSLSNLAENTVKTVGDIGTDVYKTTSKATQQTLGNIEKAGEQISSGVSDIYENTGKEIDRNKNAIIGTVLAPVTGGASLALAAEDDTSVGKAVDEGLHWVDDNKATIAGLTAGALTGGLGTALLAGMAGKTMFDDPAKEKFEKKVNEARANALARESAMMSKQSMLANELSMTARRAMAKRAAANLRKNTSTPASQFLGGEQQTLG